MEGLALHAPAACRRIFNLQGSLHLEAAQSYAQTFADNAVKAVHRASGEYPSGKPWEVLTVEFTVPGDSVSGPQWWAGLQAQRGIFVSGGNL